jgi:hypothetical protein
MQLQMLAGRVTHLRMFALAEFGVRASFVSEASNRPSICCAVGGDLAREFVDRVREGDWVIVQGSEEPRPHTASAATPWRGRFRVKLLHAVAAAARAAA